MEATLAAEPRSDAQLFAHFREDGDREALAELFLRHQAPLLQLARRIGGSEAAADDAVQQALLAVLAAQAEGRLAAVGQVRSWLLSVVGNSARGGARREGSLRRRTARAARAAGPDALGASDDGAGLQVACEAVQGCLSSVPEAFRLPMTMHYVDGWSFADIGTALQRNEATVRSQARRGLERMRTLLSRRGVAVSSLVLAAALGRLPATETTAIWTPAALQNWLISAKPSPVMATATGWLPVTMALALAPILALLAWSAPTISAPSVHETALPVVAVPAPENAADQTANARSRGVYGGFLLRWTAPERLNDLVWPGWRLGQELHQFAGPDLAARLRIADPDLRIESINDDGSVVLLHGEAAGMSGLHMGDQPPLALELPALSSPAWSVCLAIASEGPRQPAVSTQTSAAQIRMLSDMPWPAALPSGGTPPWDRQRIDWRARPDGPWYERRTHGEWPSRAALHQLRSTEAPRLLELTVPLGTRRCTVSPVRIYTLVAPPQAPATGGF